MKEPPPTCTLCVHFNDELWMKTSGIHCYIKYRRIDITCEHYKNKINKEVYLKDNQNSNDLKKE